jgi:hypothetical protein
MVRRKINRRRKESNELFIPRPYKCTNKTLILTPNGDAGLNELIPVGSSPTYHYQAVDEGVMPDGVTTYLHTDTSPSVGSEAFTFTNHSTETGVIASISVYAAVAEVSLGGVHAQLAIWNAGMTSISYGSIETILAISPTFTMIGEIFTTDADGNPWTWSTVDSLIAGIKLIGKTANEAQVTAIYVVVSYCE